MLIRAYSYKNMVDIYLLKEYTFCSQYSRCPQGGSASGAGTPANQPRAGARDASQRLETSLLAVRFYG